MGTPSKDTTKKLHKAIRKMYDKLINEEEFGVRKYTNEYCIAKTAAQYFRSPDTVKRIVYSGAV